MSVGDRRAQGTSALAILADADWAKRLRDDLSRREDAVVVAPAAMAPFVAALAANRSGEARHVLVLTATSQQADDLAIAIAALEPSLTCAAFPSWETLPHERLSPSRETMGRRAAVLRRIVHPDALGGPGVDVLTSSIRAALQPITAGLGSVVPAVLEVGGTCDLVAVPERLVELGYERAELVERRGQFAVRGGILDVFCPQDEHPLRVELWGDAVESIRAFAVADQRSLTGGSVDSVGPVIAGPVAELLLTTSVRERAAALAASHPAVRELAELIAQGLRVDGMEALAAVLVDGLECLIDLLPADTVILLVEPERVAARADDLVATAAEFLAASWQNLAAADGATTQQAPIDLQGSSYLSVPDLRERASARGLSWLDLTPLRRDDQLTEQSVITVGASEFQATRAGLERVLSSLAEHVRDGWSVLLACAGQGSAQRLVESLTAADVPAALGDGLHADLRPGVVLACPGPLRAGFMTPTERLAVLTDADLLGQRSTTKDMARMPSRRKRTIDHLTLVPGDFVVHEQHGVGRYVEMARREVAGALREYLVLEYASSKRGQPPDRLYVPTDQLDSITRYVGGEAPAVHRLGGADWQQAKGRARKAVRQIADQLIKLYAARQSTRGHAFAQDTVWQHELEDAFAYVETPDQLSTIEEVKADMERTVPMDRLICGDVGYGKTEIAVRAAFKAVQDGKQVAVLVPTTLLVQQHFATFSERYSPFPVRVAALSRFTPPGEVTKALEGMRDGTVDVVIGTHRLLSKDVVFKDLGLVIVDEEQRFGVEHKEFLKALRMNVDVLAMSATPIPRTLEMAVTGIREMSVIQTPPEERHPVLTFVGPYDQRQIAAAIRRELIRDGQVFFVHNRVESIERVAARLRELVPQARIAVAHGQMSEHALEQVIIEFWEKRVDVLVCTTIVESGIDIPNANTLIVDRADMFGLSQLHQLRGRVGRGRERAHAYFLYDPSKPLTETAHERLVTVAQHADLGAGMHIALKDLEIRGAGNLLGGEQSGHIADVGFDLYVRLVGEALAEVKGQPLEPAGDVKVELPVDASIPAEYLPHERLRLEAYKRLADAHSDSTVDDVAAEFTDRYGPLPQPVQNLLAVARLRVLARSAGVGEIIAQSAHIRFHPVVLAESAQLRLNRLYPGSLVKPATSTILIPRPMTALVGGEPVRDLALLDWVTDVLTSALPTAVPSAASAPA